MYRFTPLSPTYAIPALSDMTIAFVGSNGVDQGVFSETGGLRSTITTAGTTAPTGVLSPYFTTADVSGSTVAFRGSYGVLYQDSGIFTGSGGPLTIIAKAGDPAPRGAFSHFSDASIDQGTVAFSDQNYGVFTGNGGPLTIISKSLDPAPIGVLYAFSTSPDISGSNVAFAANYGDGSQNGTGVFVSNGGPLTTIAKTGDSGPNGPFTFYSFLDVDPVLSGNKVAFRVTDGPSRGIFAGTGGSLSAIVQPGDDAPSGAFVGFSKPAISGDTIAFGGYFGNGSQSGVFTSKDGVRSTVLASGHSLFGSTVQNVGFSRFGLDDKGTGRLAIGYSLTDGRSGVLIATPVPEPLSQWLLITAGLAVSLVGPRKCTTHHNSLQKAPRCRPARQ